MFYKYLVLIMIGNKWFLNSENTKLEPTAKLDRDTKSIHHGSHFWRPSKKSIVPTPWLERIIVHTLYNRSMV